MQRLIQIQVDAMRKHVTYELVLATIWGENIKKTTILCKIIRCKRLKNFLLSNRWREKPNHRNFSYAKHIRKEYEEEAVSSTFELPDLDLEWKRSWCWPWRG